MNLYLIDLIEISENNIDLYVYDLFLMKYLFN